MTKYWALDYVDNVYCELVADNQLYKSEDEAKTARDHKRDPEHYDVTWYTRDELENDVYDVDIHIDEKLRVHPDEW